jgi:phage tail-like protein
MARATASDPIRNFKFLVEITPTGGAGAGRSSGLALAAPNIGKLGFSVMSGISVQNEMVGYREGGMNTHTHKLVGQSDFAPVTFSRGVFFDQPDMWRWQEFIHSWNQASTGSSSVDNDYRCDITVKVFDHPVSAGSYQEAGQVNSNNPTIGSAKLGVKLFNCWPGAYALSDLSAGESGIMIQQLTVHHEGFYIAWSAEEIGKLATVG